MINYTIQIIDDHYEVGNKKKSLRSNLLSSSDYIKCTILCAFLVITYLFLKSTPKKCTYYADAIDNTRN